MLPNDDGILIVDSAQATIRGNTIGNSKVAGIELRDTRVPVDIDGNWIGVRRDGEVASNDVGVFLGPGSAVVRVGAGAPNVIAGNRVGIAIEQGAREAEIWRNWLGLVPSGQNMTDADLPTARVVPNRTTRAISSDRRSGARCESQTTTSRLANSESWSMETARRGLA